MEMITPRKVGSGLLACAGALLLTVRFPGSQSAAGTDAGAVPTEPHDDGRFFWGICALIVEQLALTVVALLTKRAVVHFSPVFVTAAQVFFASWFLMALAVLGKVAYPRDTSLLSDVTLLFTSFGGIVTLLYSVPVLTCLGYWLKAVGFRHLSASVVMLYQALQPVVATLLAVFFLGEQATVSSLSGTVLVMVALVMIGDRPAPPTSNSAPARGDGQEAEKVGAAGIEPST
eukprot:NODE_17743_length_927_cov_9.797500.p1 GENE.NODE_17743_length_927_cov_9.797500~~NODE_17743_length_927_cov_9.797500.p1  ORF type:complete len:242 (-),score=57.18 NODE_17743_length_927_cov_9.797500:201-893(-)